jgi:hypothetical protein
MTRPQPPYAPPPGQQPPWGPPLGQQPEYGRPPVQQPPYGPPPGRPYVGPPPGQPPYGWPPGPPPAYGVQQPPYGPPPGPAGPGEGGKKPWFKRWWAIALAAVLVIGIANAASEDDAKNAAASGPETSASTKPSSSGSAKSKAPAASKPAPAPEPTGFGDGTYRIGTDMPPGTYRSSAEDGLCYWARLSGFGGTLEEIIANGNTGPEIVRVAEGDAGFQTAGCGDWVPIDGTYPSSPASSFGDGTFRVGKHLAPGTYRANGAPGDLCYWARLSNFSHAGVDGIIANGNSPGVVEISASDAGFTSFGCGDWTR